MPPHGKRHKDKRQKLDLERIARETLERHEREDNGIDNSWMPY